LLNPFTGEEGIWETALLNEESLLTFLINPFNPCACKDEKPKARSESTRTFFIELV
jgi:hypothetical protein